MVAIVTSISFSADQLATLRRQAAASATAPVSSITSIALSGKLAVGQCSEPTARPPCLMASSVE
jgi:hypothetical protein